MRGLFSYNKLHFNHLIIFLFLCTSVSGNTFGFTLNDNHAGCEIRVDFIPVHLISDADTGFISIPSRDMKGPKPAGIKVTADPSELKANGQDLSYVSVELVDLNGIRCNTAERILSFSISGPGEIIGLASSNPKTTESFEQPFSKEIRGRCLIIIKSGSEAGEVLLKISGNGLKSAEFKLKIN